MKAKGEEMQSTNLHKSTQKFVEISEDWWRTEKGLGVSSQELGLAAITFAKATVVKKNTKSAKDWPMVRLGDVCETLTDGDWIESKDQSSEGIRLIQTGNVGDGAFLRKENRARYISLETFKRLKCTEIFAGDVLVSRLPEPVGRACIVEDIGTRMITAVDCSIIRFTRDVYAKYFVLFSQSPKYQESISFLVTGTTRARISRKNLSNIQIPLPPIEVQKEIVERLEKELGEADKVAAEFKRMVELADKEFKAELDEVFGGLGNWEGEASTNLLKSTQKFVEISEDLWRTEKGLGVSSQELGLAATTFAKATVVKKNARSAKPWPMVRLGDVCEIKGGFAFKSKEYADSGLQVVRISDLSGNEISKKDAVYYPETVGLEKYIIKEECILICLTGSIGKMAIVNDGVKRYLNQRVGLLTCSCEILIKYVWHYLHSERVLDIWDKAKTSVNGNLRNSDITDLKIQLPSLSVQKDVVAKLDAAKERCEKLKAEAERGLRAAENLRKAILSEAFEL